eukprot:Phypoly_transcript_02416.p1 GENE.Phypoly_transcript_02416~~Phypoly_transcript_02416.p1  ORF type:complete len:883 (+),score=118.98 Phypoly_transcript_02416:39-2651(+)
MASGVWILLLLVACVTGKQYLLENWKIQNSVKVTATPSQISTAGFDDSSWYPAVVPSNGTVMAVLLQNNVYANITQNVNLLEVDSEQFLTPWWYRTEFPAITAAPLVTVTFKGINYKANVWFNGQQISTINETVGTFRYFTFNITQSTSQTNAFELEIFKPFNEVLDVKNVTGLDLAITFVDWSVPPPDSNMGLWQEVVLDVFESPVVVQYPMVETYELAPDYSSAYLQVMFELVNYANTTVDGTISLHISELERGECKVPQTVPPGVSQVVINVKSHCKMLGVSNPRLWWPAQMGQPNLYTLTIAFLSKTGVSYEITNVFGIRTTSSEVDQNGHRVYQVNGKNILIRGAGWAPDLFQRTDFHRLETEMQYVVHMNLNAIRLEGKFESDTLFNLADQYGVLMMPGICCCDSWQDWGRWDEEHYFIAEESVRSQVKRLRIHPSILVFLYSSDLLPPQDVETLYLSVFAEEFWPNPTLASAGEYTSNITGPTGVKMSGPYSWVSPNYWLLDNGTVGGAFGFLTEGGPGEAPLTWDSFVQTFSPENYWPINNVWDLHCGAWYGNFNNLDRFTTPLDARYGQANSAQDYIKKSQVATYEGQRAMFEGYSRNKYVSTGVIQWMLNNAFSEMIWHLYDSYLVTGGGYYGSKKACEPIHIMYSYNDGSIWVVNSRYDTIPANLSALAYIYNIDGTIMYSNSVILDALSPDSASELFVLPEVANLTSTYFLQLRLFNQTQEISNNFYWLSTTPDVPDFDNSTWYNTPCSQYADFTLLEQLPAVQVGYSFNVTEINMKMVLTAYLWNNNPDTAFFIHITIINSVTGANILPVFWDDNYVTLLPHATTAINATFNKADLGGAQPDLLVDWYNDGSSDFDN